MKVNNCSITIYNKTNEYTLKYFKNYKDKGLNNNKVLSLNYEELDVEKVIQRTDAFDLKLFGYYFSYLVRYDQLLNASFQRQTNKLNNIIKDISASVKDLKDYMSKILQTYPEMLTKETSSTGIESMIKKETRHLLMLLKWPEIKPTAPSNADLEKRKQNYVTMTTNYALLRNLVNFLLKFDSEIFYSLALLQDY